MDLKKITIITAMLAIIVSALPAYAATKIAEIAGRPVYGIEPKDQPDGFRGVKWGEDITKIPGMEKRYTYEKNDQLIGYERAGDKLFIGDVPLERITYVAFKGRLLRVHIDVQTYTDETPVLKRQDEAIRKLDRLSEIMLAALGDIPSGSNGGYREYLWGIKGTLLVVLGYNGSSLMYTHLPTLEESMAYEAGVVKDAKNDL